MGTMPLVRPNTGMKMKLCSLKYTPSTFIAAWEKDIISAFIAPLSTEEMAWATVAGKPTTKMLRMIFPSGRKWFQDRRSSALRVWLR